MIEAPGRYSVTVAGVVILTLIAALTTVLAGSAAAAAVVGLASTNILALLAALKAGSTHSEVKAMNEGGITKQIIDAANVLPGVPTSTDSQDEVD